MKNVEGNYFDKHHSSNPLVKYLMRQFHEKIHHFIKKSGAHTILDIGCGEGYTTQEIAKMHPVRIEGIEYGAEMVEKAKKLHPNLHFEQGSIHHINREDASYDLVLCTEVLEHVESPSKAVRELARVSKKFVLVSVPNEPWWRILNCMRGKYLKDLGNTPGHINHWSKYKLEKMLKPHFKRVITKNALTWNIALCIKE